MKYFWFPAATLALLLGLSLWNAQVIEGETDSWCDAVEAARSAVRNGDTVTAAERMEELREAWQARRAYYHSILEHDEMDDAEEFFARAMSALGQQDTDDFAAETAALIAQLRVIAEMQGLSLENVL